MNVTSEHRSKEVMLLCVIVVCRAAHTHKECETKVFTAVTMNINILWGVALCRLVNIHRRFGEAQDLQLQEDFSTLKIIGTGLLREDDNYKPIWVSHPRSLSFLQRHGFQ